MLVTLWPSEQSGTWEIFHWPFSSETFTTKLGACPLLLRIPPYTLSFSNGIK